MSDELLTFSKYKGKPIEVLSNDRDYSTWLINQDWFVGKYPELHTIIVNNFQVPDETPEHNFLQGLFLEDEFCEAFVRVAEPDTLGSSTCQTVTISNKRFEKNAIDVSFYAAATFSEGNLPRTWKGQLVDSQAKYLLTGFTIEIKPAIGDDYPTVLRKMSAQNCKYLFLDRYTGQGVGEYQFVEIFRNEGIRVVRHEDIRAKKQA